MSIEIKSLSGRILYTAENAQDVREALTEAVKQRAYLQGAYLRGADLQGADLQGAYLQGAYLRGADLQGAYLQGADLQGAYLRGAYLRGADLQGAYLRGADLRGADLQGDINSPRHPLHAIRQDHWSILDQAPGEVVGLREAMVEGRINGSVYRGECACLVGTIANLRDCAPDELGDIGIPMDSSRPAEQWIIPVNEGDKPLPLDTEEWPSESAFRLSHAFAWTEEWLESRTKIARALEATA